MAAKPKPAVTTPTSVLSAEEAIAKYQSAVSSEPTAANYLELGAAYYIAKKWQDAIPAFEKAVALDSKQAFAYYYLGILYAALGQRDRANAALDQVLKVSNNQMLKQQAQARIPKISSPADLGAP